MTLEYTNEILKVLSDSISEAQIVNFFNPYRNIASSNELNNRFVEVDKNNQFYLLVNQVVAELQNEKLTTNKDLNNKLNEILSIKNEENKEFIAIFQEKLKKIKFSENEIRNENNENIQRNTPLVQNKKALKKKEEGFIDINLIINNLHDEKYTVCIKKITKLDSIIENKDYTKKYLAPLMIKPYWYQGENLIKNDSYVTEILRLLMGKTLKNYKVRQINGHEEKKGVIKLEKSLNLDTLSRFKEFNDFDEKNFSQEHLKGIARIDKSSILKTILSILFLGHNDLSPLNSNNSMFKEENNKIIIFPIDFKSFEITFSNITNNDQNKVWIKERYSLFIEPLIQNLKEGNEKEVIKLFQGVFFNIKNKNNHAIFRARRKIKKFLLKAIENITIEEIIQILKDFTLEIDEINKLVKEGDVPDGSHLVENLENLKNAIEIFEEKKQNAEKNKNKLNYVQIEVKSDNTRKENTSGKENLKKNEYSMLAIKQDKCTDSKKKDEAKNNQDKLKSEKEKDEKKNDSENKFIKILKLIWSSICKFLTLVEKFIIECEEKLSKKIKSFFNLEGIKEYNNDKKTISL